MSTLYPSMDLEDPSLPPQSLPCSHLQSLDLNTANSLIPEVDSVPLFDSKETLLINTEEQFLKMLKITATDRLKVVTIFGNTGDGKSHTLNYTFFKGEQKFPTSKSQTSCTLGVRAMYNSEMKVLFLDTEGFQGVSKLENHRTRLLLKVLAVSDVIIYKTDANRLAKNMYIFLGGASVAYREHFSTALEQVFKKSGVEKPVHILGPSVVIFHLTDYTDPLDRKNLQESPEEIIRRNFGECNVKWEGSNLKYVGHKKTEGARAFRELKSVVQFELDRAEVRSPREAKYVYIALKGLNEKYQREVADVPPHTYFKAFFTCSEKCQSCGCGCTLSMGHKDDNEPHLNKEPCRFQHQFQNSVFLCRKCLVNGVEQIVKYSQQSSIFSTLWTGYAIVCPKCGEIYQSRKYLYGNKDPEDEAVRSKYVHVWSGEMDYFQDGGVFGSGNSAQMVLDGVTTLTNVVASVGSQPKKMITDWAMDRIAPGYWRPNHEIKECHRCKEAFASNASKHHCRACGEGFCELCSSKSQPVPARGWPNPVRVCDDCFREEPPTLSHLADDTELRARKIGETVINSVCVVKSVLDIPTDFIKESARPSYWTPDVECKDCVVCGGVFGPLLPLHHCRDCGKGVCDGCSSARKAVPRRGWHAPARVCDSCAN